MRSKSGERYGTLPECGFSRNYADGSIEAGISVADTEWKKEPPWKNQQMHQPQNHPLSGCRPVGDRTTSRQSSPSRSDNGHQDNRVTAAEREESQRHDTRNLPPSVSQAKIARYERGEVDMSVSRLIAIMRAVGIGPEILAGL